MPIDLALIRAAHEETHLNSTWKLEKPTMKKLSSLATLTALLVVSLTLPTCRGLERTAHDYLVPLYKSKGFDPHEISRDALWFVEIFQKYTSDNTPHDIRDDLQILKERLKSGFTFLSGNPEPEFDGLRNENLSGPDSSAKVGGRTNVVIKFIDSLIVISEGNSCDFDHWLTISKLFYTLYGIPEENKLTIHGSGMRFSNLESNQARPQLYKYIKYLTRGRISGGYLAKCLKKLEISAGSSEESKVDLAFAEEEGKSSLTDEELWRVAFYGDMIEAEEESPIPQDKSDKLSENLNSLFSIIESKPEIRKSLEKSAGIVTLAMGLAPEELQNFKALSFGLSKQVEYLRLLNQHSYCKVDCIFV